MFAPRTYPLIYFKGPNNSKTEIFHFFKEKQYEQKKSLSSD